MSFFKEKPNLVHGFVLGLVAVLFSVFLITGDAWNLTARAAKSILDLANVNTYYFDSVTTIFLRLLDGSNVGFQILAECSGLISVAAFSIIFIFTVGLLRGSLLTKAFWFIVSICVGLIWNISRLALALGVAYQFGIVTFFVFHYILSPSVDFIWVVSMWALAMSRLRSKMVVMPP